MTDALSKEELRPLLDYLRAYRAWTTDGAPSGEPFTRCSGLCFQPQAPTTSVQYALSQTFGVHSTYPFGGEVTYYEEYYARTAHLNKKRLAWCDKMIKELSA